jgi:hypothetical protein
MVKKGSVNDNRGQGMLQHGRHSEVIKKLQERLVGLPLDDVDRMKFETYIDYAKNKDFAFDIDMVLKSHLINSLRDTDKKLMSYEGDLAVTQGKIADAEADVMFHRGVLKQLKTDYVKEEDSIVKNYIYLRIIEAEKSIATFERLVQNYIELRNKIRKEIDKGKYQSKALQLKENEMAGNGAKSVVMDVDFEML